MKHTEQEILDGNKLIAEFMGYPISKVELGFTSKEAKTVMRRLEYHTSWDWLMPVVEKIEEFGYAIDICQNDCNIYENNNSGNFLKELNRRTKIEAVYAASIEFIKWHKEKSLLTTINQ